MASFIDKLGGLPDAVRNFSRPIAEVRKPGLSPERPAVPETKIRAVGSVETVASPEHRDGHNEDAAFVDEGRAFAMLSDGIASSGEGELASRTAANAVRDALPGMDRVLAAERARFGSPYVSAEAATAALRQVAEAADTGIRRLDDRPAGEVKLGRPTATLLLARVVETGPDARLAVFCSVGDSKAYVERADGRLEPVNMPDDGALERWVRDGFSVVNPKTLEKRVVPISSDEAYLIEQSTGTESFQRTWLDHAERTGADRGPERLADVLTLHRLYFGRERKKTDQALGKGSVPKIRSASVPLGPGDKIRLMSDGIPDNLTLEEMQQNAGRLVEAAGERMRDTESVRRKPDDATQVILEVEAAPVPVILPERIRRAKGRDQKKIDELRKKLGLTG